MRYEEDIKVYGELSVQLGEAESSNDIPAAIKILKEMIRRAEEYKDKNERIIH